MRGGVRRTLLGLSPAITRMTVAVLIVNWNGGDLLSRCLESLDSNAARPITSSSSTTAAPTTRWREPLSYLTACRVDSTARECRFRQGKQHRCSGRAGRLIRSRLLNPGRRCRPGWLEALMAAADREPTVAAFASQMRLASDPTYSTARATATTCLDGHGEMVMGCRSATGQRRRRSFRALCRRRAVPPRRLRRGRWLRRTLFLLLRGCRPWLSPAAPRATVPLRAAGHRRARELGAERIPE